MEKIVSPSRGCLLTASSFQNYNKCSKFHVKVFKVLGVLIFRSHLLWKFFVLYIWTISQWFLSHIGKNYIKKNAYEVKMHSLEIWQKQGQDCQGSQFILTRILSCNGYKNYIYWKIFSLANNKLTIHVLLWRKKK